MADAVALGDGDAAGLLAAPVGVGDTVAVDDPSSAEPEEQAARTRADTVRIGRRRLRRIISADYGLSVDEPSSPASVTWVGDANRCLRQARVGDEVIPIVALLPDSTGSQSLGCHLPVFVLASLLVERTGV